MENIGENLVSEHDDQRARFIAVNYRTVHL